MMFRSALLAVALALASPVMAQTDEDRAAVSERLDALIAMISAQDVGGMIDSLPPPVLAITAEQTGVSVDQMRDDALAEFEATPSGVTFGEVGYDLTEAEWGLSPLEREYAVVPVDMVATVDGQSFRVRSYHLALMDQGEWYVMHVDRADQLAVLAEAYPDLSRLTIPAQVTTLIE